MDNQLSGILALFVLACYGVAWCSAAAEVQFDYDNQTAWLDLAGSQCGGNRQSPINIIADQAVTNSSYGQLQMLGWNETVSGQLLNTGRTVKFVPGQKDAMTITQRGEYTVDLFHFHWGNASSVGSEHRVDGMQFDGELHFVHTKSNPPAANTDGDAFMVVAVFLRGVPTSVTAGSVWENFQVIPQLNQNLNISVLTYADLLPSNLSYFYYEGSLTTPLCNEAVHFVVLQNPIEIPSEILVNLRATPTTTNVSNPSPLTENFRDTQPLNGRTVYRFNSASNSVPAAIIILLCLLIVSSLM